MRAKPRWERDPISTDDLRGEGDRFGMLLVAADVANDAADELVALRARLAVVEGERDALLDARERLARMVAVEWPGTGLWCADTCITGCESGGAFECPTTINAAEDAARVLAALASSTEGTET